MSEAAFFDSEANRLALLEELARWRGTPFVAHTAIRGVGVDCVRFAGTVLAEVGAILPVEWPQYAIRGVGGMWREMIERTLADSAPGVSPVARGAEACGDVIILGGRSGIVHVGLAGDRGRWWHAKPNYGVSESRLDDRNIMRHWLAAWRVMA